MKILGILTSPADPSPRVRILNYAAYLQAQDASLTPCYFSPHPYAEPPGWAYKMHKLTRINPWRISWAQKLISRVPVLLRQYHYDMIWQNRLIIPHQYFYEKKIAKPIVFDYDDAIWLGDGEKAVAGAIKTAALVFAGNEYLAEFGYRHNKNTVIIPSTIDTAAFLPKQTDSEFFTIGWIGTVTNFPYLDLVKSAILQFLAADSKNRFMVVSSEPPPQFQFDNCQLIFKQWSLAGENDLVNEFSIGIMPLPDNDFTRGKCSYKMLQYLACKRPAVVSPVGMNNKILGEAVIGLSASTEQDWLNAFSLLKNDKDFYRECAENGRQLVEKNYSVNRYAPLIHEQFVKLLQPKKLYKPV